MSTVTKVLKIRAGSKSVMNGSKAATVLAAREDFLELQGSEIGQVKCKLKMGDGVTPYKDLPYAMGDTSTDPIDFGNNSSGTATAALSSVVSGAKLSDIISGLKQAATLNAGKVNNVVNILDSAVTLSKNGWQGSSAPWSQTVTLNGVTASGKYQLFSNCTTNNATDRKNYNKAFGIITQGSATTANNTITFNVWKKPTVDVSVRVVSLVGTYVGGSV